ncbi:MAG: hypothetical protein V4514_06220 [Pseudomonadota bacterium]|uniref:hypothetical protein n=1 Tax=Phenylobacterium sp. TaxID=1871053 RepID=UPI0025D94106|nr:hypothetical protein [Phenylobacterium sp.]MBT9470351.1 hypothetical protein [Phenylobacterium sp.]
MIMKPLLAGAAVALLALPVMAQQPGVSGSAAEEPGAAMSSPPAGEPAQTSARTGAATNTSATVADTDLKIGAAVKDGSGMEIGKIAKVGKSGGQTMVTLSSGARTAVVPASSLMKSGGTLMTSESKAEVWGPR